MNDDTPCRIIPLPTATRAVCPRNRERLAGLASLEAAAARRRSQEASEQVCYADLKRVVGAFCRVMGREATSRALAAVLDQLQRE